MKAMNEVEKEVLQMVAEGKSLHGWAREVLIEMILREVEEEKG